MKNKLWILIFLAACSSQEEESNDATVIENPEQEEWIVYEGLVKSREGYDVKMQLSLLQNSAGLESSYRSEEEYINTPEDRLLTNRQGKYSILYGSGNDMVITLDESTGGSLGWYTGKGYGIGVEKVTDKLKVNAAVGKISLRTSQNSDEFVQLDENSNLINESKYLLKKRSILFTVEGFVTLNPGNEFFEMHTRETWNLAKVGSFDEVEKKYSELAREKFEGIYLKGVAYYIQDVDSTGMEINSMVIKRIIHMRSHEAQKAVNIALQKFE